MSGMRSGAVSFDSNLLLSIFLTPTPTPISVFAYGVYQYFQIKNYEQHKGLYKTKLRIDIAVNFISYFSTAGPDIDSRDFLPITTPNSNSSALVLSSLYVSNF